MADLSQLYNIISSFGDEAEEYITLLNLGNTRSGSGNVSFISLTSGTTYDTAVGTGTPAYDANIVGFGQDGLFYWLSLDIVLGTYKIDEDNWDSVRDLAFGSVTGIDLSSSDYTLASTDYAKKTLIVTTAHATNAIILPTDEYRFVIINTDAANSVFVKKSGGVAVEISLSTNALVGFNGTDYKLIGAANIATDSDMTNGTDDEKIVTPKKVADNFVPRVISVDENLPRFNGVLGLIEDSGQNYSALTKGWIAAGETWTYLSATTITVPSGAASKYSKGDKFKLTANSVELQGYIVSVADTVLTVLGDALTNHTFSDNYYSKIENPQGFTHWFNWTPSFTGFSVDPTGFHRFSIYNGMVKLAIRQTVNGTSNATLFQISLPITATALSGMAWYGTGTHLDNGAVGTTQAVLIVNGSGTDIILYTNNALAAWTASGGKRLAYAAVDYQF